MDSGAENYSENESDEIIIKKQKHDDDKDEISSPSVATPINKEYEDKEHIIKNLHFSFKL